MQRKEKINMGYTTDYYGSIKLSSKDIEDKLEKFIKDNGGDWDEYFDLEGIELVDGKIIIGGYSKMYKEELEKFCLFIAKIDKKSSGEIECSGEEKDDLWKIIVANGKVDIEQGYITYKDGVEFKSNEINKDVYKITKDKTLLKEIIVEELEK